MERTLRPDDVAAFFTSATSSDLIAGAPSFLGPLGAV